MDIKIDFNIGDPVWFMHNNKIIESKMQGLRIEVSPKTPDKIETTLFCNTEPGQIVNIKADLDGAFHSREELLASL